MDVDRDAPVEPIRRLTLVVPCSLRAADSLSLISIVRREPRLRRLGTASGEVGAAGTGESTVVARATNRGGLGDGVATRLGISPSAIHAARVNNDSWKASVAGSRSTKEPTAQSVALSCSHPSSRVPVYCSLPNFGQSRRCQDFHEQCETMSQPSFSRISFTSRQ